MSLLKLEHITCFRGKEKILDDLNFEMQADEFCAIIGESGTGKTTLLRVISGLENEVNGTIQLKGKILLSENEFVAAQNRNIGMVFQQFNLFPHLNVIKNICFGLKKGFDEQRVVDLISLFGLNGLEKRMPSQLSGGQQQRVALARTLVLEPDLLLLDEPFSNLDRDLRISLRFELKKILKQLQIPTIFVLHDFDDALALSDEIAIMDAGKIVQKDIPSALLKQPRHASVLQLFDDYNILDYDDLPEDWKKVVPIKENFKKIGLPYDAISIDNENGDITAIYVDKFYTGKGYDLRIKSGDLKCWMKAKNEPHSTELKLTIDTQKIKYFNG